MQDVFIHLTLLIIISHFSFSFLSFLLCFSSSTFPFLLLTLPSLLFLSLLPPSLRSFRLSLSFVQIAWVSKQIHRLYFSLLSPSPPLPSYLPSKPRPFPTFSPHSETWTSTPSSFVSDFWLFSPTSIFFFSQQNLSTFSFKTPLRSILFISTNSKLIHALITSLFWERSLTCLPVIKVSLLILWCRSYTIVLKYYS